MDDTLSGKVLLWFSGVCVVTVVAIFAAVATSLPPAPVAEQAAPATTMTWKDGAARAVHLSSMGGAGSGVPLSCWQEPDGSYLAVILTASHCVDDGEVLIVSQGPDLTVMGSAELLARHPWADAALLFATLVEPLEVVEMRAAGPETFETVYAAGFPRGLHLTVTQGIVSQKDRASAAVYPGNSGGPLLDEQGRLVGIVRAAGVTGGMMGRVIIYHDMAFVSIQDINTWVRALVVLR